MNLSDFPLADHRYQEARVAEVLAAADQIRKPKILSGQELENFNTFFCYQGGLQKFFENVATIKDPGDVIPQSEHAAAVAFAKELQQHVRFGGFGFERVWVWILVAFSGCFSCAGKALAIKIEAFAYGFFQKMGPKLDGIRDEIREQEEQIPRKLEVEQRFRNSQRKKPLSETALKRELAMMQQVAQGMSLEHLGTDSFWKTVDSRLESQAERMHIEVKYTIIRGDKEHQKNDHPTLDREAAGVVSSLHEQGIYSYKDPRFSEAMSSAGLGE